jgi:hypothetical protein
VFPINEEDLRTAEMENNACSVVDGSGRECRYRGTLRVLDSSWQIAVRSNTYCFYPLPPGMVIDGTERVG